MKLTRFEHLYQLTFLPRAFPVNCYLVEEEDGLTLIDAALPYSAKAILRTAERIGKPVKRIVLTHVHEDHVGALDALKQALPLVPLHVSAREARLMDQDLAKEVGEPDTPIRSGFPKKIKTRAGVLLQEGDRIGSLRAIAAPGHSPGQMAFLDERNGVMIAGDAFQVRGGFAVAGQMRPLFPFMAWGTWDKRLALESARKLRDYRPSLLAVGHGKMLAQPGASLDRVIAEAERSLG